MKGSLFDTAIRIAMEQFRKDAALAEKCEDYRTMDAFITQAQAMQKLLEYAGDEGTLIIQPDFLLNDKNAKCYELDRLVHEHRRTTKCMRCGMKCSDHVGMKCPFASTVFQQENTT
jgi:hypothetical protein